MSHADAILDGTIGLELLLGDDQNQSLAYKLRLRAAALTLLQTNPTYPTAEVASKVKRLYDARSAIVHGRRKKRSKKASEPMDTSNVEERQVASDLLRFVLNVLLTNPEYQDPVKIDEALLLRGDEASKSNGAARQPVRSRKSSSSPDPASEV
jgi:Apea-like HEPN